MEPAQVIFVGTAGRYQVRRPARAAIGAVALPGEPAALSTAACAGTVTSPALVQRSAAAPVLLAALWARRRSLVARRRG